MIRADQPTLFPDSLAVAFSSRKDGSLLDKSQGRHAPNILELREAFCRRNGISYGDVVYQAITYGSERTYDIVREVGETETTRFAHDIEADALITREPGVGLFLPVADCAATVLYDPVQQVLALLHLGRHSTMSELLSKTLEELRRMGTNLADLLVWMSPHAGRQSYRLEWFDTVDTPEWRPFVDTKPDGFYVDLAAYNKARLMHEGIRDKNIEVSTIDTMRNTNYFSHANGEHGGRMALLAYMR